MIQIRKGVFETNSSSSHSIVMMKNDKPTEDKVDPDYRVDDDGVLDFWYEPDLEFGRSPFEFLTDWYGRLRYCIASYSGDDDKIKELEEICRRRVDRFKHFKFRKDRWENKENRGYIDHQSDGILDAALKRYNISLEEFIFNDRFIVVVDGDEYRVFCDLIQSEMFNKDNVANITSVYDEIDQTDWKNEE